MPVDKNQSKNLILFLLKTLFLILGLNIFLSSVFTVIKLEFRKNNEELKMNLNIKKLKYDQNVQFYIDIY